MRQVSTFPISTRLAQRLTQANAGNRVSLAKVPGYRQNMRGAFTDRLRGMWPTLAFVVGGILVGYMARKPIGKLVNKVT